jgi:RNA polymerase sigma factor (sigma-70 family)
MSTSSINNLFKLSREGDSKAEDLLFQVLHERFTVFVHHRIWNQTDAEEVVQDALTAIWKELKTIDISTSFAAWAYKVLNNRILAAIDVRRIQSSRFSGTSENISILTSSDVDPNLMASLLDCLEKICRINRRYARVLNLHYQGYETTDVCLKLNVSENALYSLLHRARGVLQRCLDSGELT